MNQLTTSVSKQIPSLGNKNNNNNNKQKARHGALAGNEQVTTRNKIKQLQPQIKACFFVCCFLLLLLLFCCCCFVFFPVSGGSCPGLALGGSERPQWTLFHISLIFLGVGVGWGGGEKVGVGGRGVTSLFKWCTGDCTALLPQDVTAINQHHYAHMHEEQIDPFIVFIF